MLFYLLKGALLHGKVKGHLLRFKRASFKLQKGIFYNPIHNYLSVKRLQT